MCYCKIMNMYPEEVLGPNDDNGTMPANVQELRDAVVGHKIVSVDTEYVSKTYYGRDVLILTLDNGTKVELAETDDCCAYTHIGGFLKNVSMVDHAIMGIGTTNGYTTWHIYADFGDLLELNVKWSSGNPFYYGYGFDIYVKQIES